jgi:type VI secretion system protein ImpL
MDRILETLTLFKSGKMASFAGVLAISALIWFLGHKLGVGEIKPLAPQINRMIAIAAVFALWLLFVGWQSLRAKKKNQALIDNLGENKESDDEVNIQEEVGHLSERLEEALSALKNTKVGKDKQKQFLYELPWYIIIGPPGAGKTTLLSNSDLHFPLSDKFGKEALRGVGGTRNCDWWFTDDAILLDTAGRYTTQDSNATVDHNAWLGFLDLLKTHRKQQPINGVIIAVSLLDILQQTQEERLQHAKSIRQRIEELHSQLNINFPIYMMFTKTDLVAGFNEFFDDLNKQEREQVWGMTFPFDENTTENNTGFNATLFKAEFKLLEQRIHRQLVEKLERERNLKRRQTLYSFPQQFTSLQGLLNEFLDVTFKSSNFQTNALLRGVYFTSATQEGSPIDRIMGSLANQFGIGHQNISSFAMKGKSFFINHLLSQVIFSESGLAGVNLKLKKKMQWLQSAAGVSTIVISLAIIMLWLNSYYNNKQLINHYQTEVEEVKTLLANSSTEADLIAQLPLLNKVRQLTDRYSDTKPPVPLATRWGLYQGSTLAQKMDIKYIELLRNTMQPHSKQLLEELLRNNQDNAGQLFTLLKVYLFLGGQEKQGASIPMIEADWNKNQREDSEDSQLNQHFLALLQNSSSDKFSLDEALIQQTRTQLENSDITNLAYQNLKNTYLHPKNIDDFKIIQKEGLKEINQSFSRISGKAWSEGIPGLFTKQGFYDVFLKHYATAVSDLKKDSWVLGKASYVADGKVEQYVLKRYQEDYIKYWQDFIDDLSIKPLGNKTQAITVLEPLTADGNNLIVKLLTAIKAETDFSVKKDKDSDEKSDKKSIKTAANLKPIPKSVDEHFKPFNKWADAEKLKKIIDLINDIFIGFNSESAFAETDNNQIEAAVNKLQAETLHLPGALKKILRQMSGEAKQKVSAAIINNMNKKLRADLDENVGRLCQANIKGVYPFVKGSSQSISIAAFSQIFSPNGTLDGFVKQNLKKNSSYPEEMLSPIRRQFSKADNIRKALFSLGYLNISFSLELLSIPEPFHSIDVTIGPVQHTFSNIGDQKKYSWPAEGISTDFLAADPNAVPEPEIPDAIPDNTNANLDPLMAIQLEPTEPEPELSPEPEPSKEKVHQEITPGNSAWELFKLIGSNQKIRMGDAVFKVSTKIQPNPFKIIRSDLRNFKCPKL